MNHLNSQLVSTPARRAKRDEPDVLLNPVDAAQLDVADGQRVRVAGATGELTGTARLDEGLRRGAVSIPHGYERVKVNSLTSATDDLDPLTGMPVYSGVPVRLTPLATTTSAAPCGPATEADEDSLTARPRSPQGSS